ncbi:MAG: hypothetical protein DMG08_17385 [Acidobacteria bacterium]|nr:MAG: hypothetical protein DMG08_17385 [Acidobacteriota bacterium]PYV01131.1 MAG: hypothetical protein DMG10_18595 [Acidobacteriota bacterium]
MSSCPDCSPLDRRQFLKTAAAATAGALAVTAAPKLRGDSETLVTTLYKSLTPEQRAKICFAFDHELRSKVDANWQITEARVGKAFTPDQQAMIEEIFRGLHNPEFYDKVVYHMKEDGGGLGAYSVAVFGEPGAGKFEFVLTGRHCTARCDGDSVEGAAFGGPIFYGHASRSFNETPDHPDNVYWFQALRANEVFKALDGRQREKALLGDPREEKKTATVELRRRGAQVGLPVADMTHDQRGLVEKVLADLLLPFRKKDRDEAMRYIKANGGVESLAMSFYKNLDIGSDGVWDVWQLESPTMVWYFRGSPHVHTWVNIRAKAMAGNAISSG